MHLKGFLVNPDGTLEEAVLTTEHSASSYGRPVLCFGGEAYGTGDVGVLKVKERSFAEALRKAGYKVEEINKRKEESDGNL